MIENDKNLNISVEYQNICTQPSEQGSFFQASQNESKEWYADELLMICWYADGSDFTMILVDLIQVA